MHRIWKKSRIGKDFQRFDWPNPILPSRYVEGDIEQSPIKSQYCIAISCAKFVDDCRYACRYTAMTEGAKGKHEMRTYVREQDFLHIDTSNVNGSSSYYVISVPREVLAGHNELIC